MDKGFWQRPTQNIKVGEQRWRDAVGEGRAEEVGRKGGMGERRRKVRGNERMVEGGERIEDREGKG